MSVSLKDEDREVAEVIENVTDNIGDMGDELSVWECVKNNPKAIFYSFLMSIGPTAFGFDNLVVGLIASMPGFQSVSYSSR